MAAHPSLRHSLAESERLDLSSGRARLTIWLVVALVLPFTLTHLLDTTSPFGAGTVIVTLAAVCVWGIVVARRYVEHTALRRILYAINGLGIFLCIHMTIMALIIGEHVTIG